VSIWHEFEPLITALNGSPVVKPRFADWRPGDQRVCILNIDKAQHQLGWSPQVSVSAGVAQLWQWVADHHAEIKGR
jgi:CDP-paratose 2-epimerase